MTSIIFLGLVFAIFLLFFRKSRKVKPSTNLPPGKTGWPILGETLDYVRRPAEFIRDRMMKHSHDVFQTSLAGEKIAVFCGPLGNKFIYSNEDKFKPWLPHTFVKALSLKSIDRDTPSLKLFVEQLLNFLKLESLQQYIHVMDSKTRDHVEMYWVPYDEVKVQFLSKEFTFELICLLSFNFHEIDQVKELAERFNTLVKGLMSVPVNLPGTQYNRAMKASKAVLDKLIDLIRKRKLELLENDMNNRDQEIQDDLLTRVLRASDKEGVAFEDDELAGLILGVLFAGLYTSSSAITFVISHLAEYPHVYARVLQGYPKMKYTWNVVCESMRLIPPAPGGFREAITDLCYAGFTTPKGWKVHWNFYSTHKDPKYFPNPEKFEPSRFEATMQPNIFVPFGKGQHMCYGNEYARIKILVFLHNVVTRFRLSKANPPEKLIYTPDPVSVEGLRIRLLPH
uniref:Cytochrome P450 n=2 Tax=Chenopodium quinoa TaxID=63459 RepID=A0A803M538_CHEQI